MKRKIFVLILLLFLFSSIILLTRKKENNNEEVYYETQQSVEVETISNNMENIDDIVDEYKYEYEVKNEVDSISNITDKKEWFIEYKKIIEKYSNIFDPPESIYDYYTDDELDMLFRVVQAEIGDDRYTFEQKCNVASVILNRLSSDRFPNELKDILTEDQFSTIKNNTYKKVIISNDVILACEYAFMIEDTTNGCLFFDSNGSLNYKFIFNDEAHNFYKIE